MSMSMYYFKYLIVRKDSDETANLARTRTRLETRDAPTDATHHARVPPWRLRAGLKDAHYTRVVAAAFLEFH